MLQTGQNRRMGGPQSENGMGDRQGETRRGNSLACRRGVAQIKNELGDHEQCGQRVTTMAGNPQTARITRAVLGVVTTLSVVLVVGGYFLVSR